jgi:phosphoglycerate dehydrogenase-like enzyme
LARAAVFVTDSLPPEALSILSDFEVFEANASDEQLAKCEALICWPSRVKRETLGKMRSLRAVQTMSAGVDVLDFASLPAGVEVFSNAGAFTDNVAEHAWGIILGVAKGIHIRNQRTAPRSLRGKTLLILGCGAIGSEVARLSKSLGMRTVGLSRSFRSPGMFDEKHPLSLLAVKITEADAVLVALPLTKETRGVVTYEILKNARESAILANVGRGELIDEEGLIRWLKERPESRYATDVFWFAAGKESFATRAWELPNFAGTLHISGVPLGEELRGAKVAAAKNVKEFLETGSARNHVDRNEYL